MTVQEKIPKTCILCQHLYLDPGWVGTDLTPGYEWSMNCRKRHFCIAGGDISEQEYAETLLTAETCPDFEPNEILKKFRKETQQ